MQLDLQSNGKAIFQNPLGQLARMNLTPDWSKQNRVLSDKVQLSHFFLGPVVVSTGSQHEFNLVLGLEMGYIVPTVLLHHSTVRALDVVDQDGSRIHRAYVDASSRFNQDCFSIVEEMLDQRMDRGLKKRLPPRNLHQIGRKTPNFAHNIFQGHLLALVESVLGVTIGTPQIAVGQSNKGAGPPRIAGFTLDAKEDLIDDQRVVHVC